MIDPDAPTPNFAGAYPLAGVRIGPAWQWAWARMADGQWHRSDELVAEMMIKGGIAKSTSLNLLGSGRRARLLEMKRTQRADGGRDVNLVRRRR